MSRKCVAASVALLGAVMVFQGAASAALVERDWKAANDRLLTYDSATGLEWLDVTVGESSSFASFAAGFGPGGAYEGFRYAKLGDVETLFGNAGLTVTGGPAFSAAAFDAPGLAAVRGFLDLIGVNRTETTVSYTSYGSPVMYDEPLGASYVLVANVQWFDAFNPGYQVSLNVAGIDRTSTGAYGVGTFLVRDAPVVPLPGGFLLLGSAIAALSWWRRR